jgi:hypothetical protein
MDEVSDLERAFFELQKIQQQLNLLANFIASKLRDQAGGDSKSNDLIDPRTGKKF